MWEKEEKALTLKSFAFAFIYSIAIAFLLPLANAFSPAIGGGVQVDWGPHFPLCPYFPPDCSMGQVDYFFIPVFFLLLVPVLVSSVVPRKFSFNNRELAFIYAMTSVIPYIVWFTGPSQITQLGFLALQVRFPVANWVQSYYPKIISPWDIKLLSPMLLGGAVVPWAEWATPLMFWIFSFISLYMFLTLWSGILRRIYVDVEGLPFPLATAATYVITQTERENGGRAKIFKSKYLWIGILISFIATFGENLHKISTLSPFLFYYDLTPQAMVQSILGFYFALPVLGFGLILPPDLLITSSISYIILFMVLPPIWIAAGQLTPLPPGYHGFFTYNRWYGKFEFTPTTWIVGGYEWFFWGILFSITVLPFIAYRGAFLESIKAALGKTTTLEKEEASLDKLLWVGTLIFAVLYIVSLVIAQVPMQYTIPAFLITALWYTSMARVRAETGGVVGGWYGAIGFWTSTSYLSQLPALYMLPADPSVVSPYIVMTTPITACQGGTGTANPMPWNLDSYSIGKFVGAKNRDLLVSQITGVLIGIIIALPLWLWLQYTYGSPTLRVTTYVNWATAQLDYQVAVSRRINYLKPPNEGSITMLIIGIVLTVVILRLRLRGGIFSYLSPAGIVMTGYGGLALWLPFLVAFTLKVVVTRIGGERLYQKILFPLGIGLMAGAALAWPILLAIYVAKGMRIF